MFAAMAVSHLLPFSSSFCLSYSSSYSRGVRDVPAEDPPRDHAFRVGSLLVRLGRVLKVRSLNDGVDGAGLGFFRARRTPPRAGAESGNLPHLS